MCESRLERNQEIELSGVIRTNRNIVVNLSKQYQLADVLLKNSNVSKFVIERFKKLCIDLHS
jgi:hypothetical protein